VGEVVRLVHLGEAVGRFRPRQVDLPERPAEPAVAVGEERGIEVLAVGLLAEAHVHRHAGLGGAAQQRLERLGGHLVLEELVEVRADLLREIGRQRHLGIRDQLDLVLDGQVQQGEHALDDLLPAHPLVVRAHLRGGDLDVACHGVFVSFAVSVPTLIPHSDGRGKGRTPAGRGFDTGNPWRVRTESTSSIDPSNHRQTR
jgi:hypothetical protein